MTQIVAFPDLQGNRGKTTPHDLSRPTLSEVWGNSADGAGIGFILAALQGRLDGVAPILWVQDRLSALDTGLPYAPGVKQPIIHVRANRVPDALAAMEMGLGCSALAAVVGEVWGDTNKLDFTASKRLAMRAEAAGVPCWLMRRGGERVLSAARERWAVTSQGSTTPQWNKTAPGLAQWQAELFRSRAVKPGTWQVRHDPDAKPQDRLCFLSASGDGSVAETAPDHMGRTAR